MGVKLVSSSGGSVELVAPTTASNYQLTVPATNGTVLIPGTASAITSGTSVTASGTSIDFTSIPSWVKRITVQIVNLGYAAAGAGFVRIGSGSLSTTGYTTSNFSINTTPVIAASSITTGFGVLNTTAGSGTTVITGTHVITNVSGNLWMSISQTARLGDNSMNFSSGYITLGGALDRLSLVATTSTFNAGTIKIMYE